MSKSRLVDTCYWDDSYIVTLDPSEKLVFIYLLTNPLTNICGVYEIAIKRIAFDTGFDKEVVERILSRFERDARCVYRNGWVALRNWIKHQANSPQVKTGIERQLAAVPVELATYVKGGEIPYAYAPPPNLTKLNSTQPNSTKPNLSEETAVALRAPARKVRGAYWQECGKLLTERGGPWAAGGKEAVSLDRLFAWGKKRAGEDWQRFLHDFLDGAWALHRGEVMGLTPKDVDFWKLQPYTPSRLLSNAAAVCAVLESLAERNREPTQEELNRMLVGIK